MMYWVTFGSTKAVHLSNFAHVWQVVKKHVFLFIPAQIKSLLGKYISQSHTIILAVIPANVDIATTEALKMAKSVDPNGERTLGMCILSIIYAFGD